MEVHSAVADKRTRIAPCFALPSRPVFLPTNRWSFTATSQPLRKPWRPTTSRQKRARSALALPPGAVKSLGQALLINTPLFLGARQSSQGMLTPGGLRHAFGLGVLLWTTMSWRGYVLCFLFLVLGSAVTRVGRERKEALGIAEKRAGARGPENLWGAAGVAAALAVGVFLSRGFGAARVGEALVVGYAGALAAKFSDTAGSEIGKAYGGDTYLLGTWERVAAGAEGGVSVEGSVASVAGAFLAAGVAWAVGLVEGGAAFGIIGVAGVVASTMESAFGGVYQEDLGMSNEVVNAMNTLVGAVVAMSLHVVRIWIG